MWCRRQRDIWVPERLTTVGNGYFGNRKSLASTGCAFISVWMVGIVYKQWDRGCSFGQLQRRDWVHDIHIYIFTSRLPFHSNREGCRVRSLVLSVFLWCSVCVRSVCLGRCAQSEVQSCSSLSSFLDCCTQHNIFFQKKNFSQKRDFYAFPIVSSSLYLIYPVFLFRSCSLDLWSASETAYFEIPVFQRNTCWQRPAEKTVLYLLSH